MVLFWWLQLPLLLPPEVNDSKIEAERVAERKKKREKIKSEKLLMSTSKPHQTSAKWLCAIGVKEKINQEM